MKFRVIVSAPFPDTIQSIAPSTPPESNQPPRIDSRHRQEVYPPSCKGSKSSRRVWQEKEEQLIQGVWDVWPPHPIAPRDPQSCNSL